MKIYQLTRLAKKCLQINISKTLLSTLLLTTSIAGTAIAGSDWRGMYVGAAVSNNSGNMDYVSDADSNSDPSGAFLMVDSSMSGGFIGYNIQNGSVVYGAEMAYFSGDFALVDLPGEKIENILDVKARIGYASGSMLIYSFAGISSGLYGEYEYYYNDYFIDFTGSNYSVGIDYKVTDSMFAGVEYIARNVGNRYRV